MATTLSVRQAQRKMSPRTLQKRLSRGITLSDLAKAYPIQYLEEVFSDGRLADGPGLGERCVTINHDLSASSGVEINCYDPYFADDNYLLGLQHAVSGALAEMQYDEEVQIQWMTWDEDERLLGQFAELRKDDPAIVAWWRSRLAQRERKRFETGELRRFRSFFFVNTKPDSRSLLSNPYSVDGGGVGNLFGAFDWVGSLGSILKESVDGLTEDQYMDLIRRTARRASTMGSLLAAGNLMNVTPLRATDVFALLRRMWSHTAWNLERSGRKNRPTLPALDAHTAPFAAYFLTEPVEEHQGLFRVGKTWHRVLTMDTLPKEAAMAVIPLAVTAGELMRKMNNLQIVHVLKPASKAQEFQRIDRRIRLLSGQSKDGPEHADNLLIIDGLIKRKMELRTATRPTLIESHYQVHFWADSIDELEEREQLIRSSVDTACSALVMPEDVNAFPFHIGFGQPGYTRMEDRSRSISLMHQEAAVIAPLSVNSSGLVSNVEKPRVPFLLETDLGTPFGIDNWAQDRVDNFGGFGIGPPGSGKSNFYQRMVLANANRDTDIIVIDGADKPSFGTVSELLGGQYLKVSTDLTWNLLGTRIENGMQQPPTADETGDILASLSALVKKGESFSPLEEAVLTAGLKHAFEHRVDPNGNVRLEHLLPGLEPTRFNNPEEKQIASTFRRIIEETGIGRFGKILNCADRMMHHWFTVFEVSDLFAPGKEQLRSIIVSLLFRYIERLTRDNITRKRKVLVIIDEAWRALLQPIMIQLIIGLYRTGRARWVSAHLLSQSTEDVRNLIKMSADTKEGKDQYKSSPIIACSSHMFLFSMDPGEAQVAGDAFGLNEAQRACLTQLGGKNGEYKELAYVCNVSGNMPRTFTKLRSRPLREELWATSTAPEDNARRAEVRLALERELASERGARNRLINALVAAGWPVNEMTPPGQLLNAGTIHRLSHNN